MLYLVTPQKCFAVLAIFTTLISLFNSVVSVKHENFKKCDQSGFCKRNRHLADSAADQGVNWKTPYRLARDSLRWNNGQLQGTILKKIDDVSQEVRLPIVISFLKSGTARVTIDEEKRQKGDIQLRHSSKARKERYNEAESWVIVGGLELSETAKEHRDSEKSVVTYGSGGQFEAEIKFSPFCIEFKRDAVTQIKFNDRGLMNVEHWRPKVDESEPKDGEERKDNQSNDDQSKWWDESFGGTTDTKPRGPESVALDITFPGYEYIYGIPEHATSLSLKGTRGGSDNHEEPYRLFNADVFEYIIDSPMSLYGSIPFMQAHKEDSTVGIFWLNAAETWVDLIKEKKSYNPLGKVTGSKIDSKTHWISESGLIDIFVFLGPSALEVIRSYSELTGFSQLPQHFSLGYHQCRWNYNSDEDVRDVDLKMSKHQIPYDVIWLDIEYTDDKKYFTWDPHSFTNPTGMLEQLDHAGRKLVIIIDPHIKNKEDYPVFQEMKSKELSVRDKNEKQYEGWCWPGSSYWIDSFNPAAIKWWISLFKYEKFKGTAPNVFIWNDMNEPSVFNGPETTMPKDNLHHGNWENRDVHNLYGMTFQNATFEALLERRKGEVRRPFILTRSYFAGSQRVGAMWTGDNQASWEHLAISFPMIINNGISGYPFAGADVGGFFGNPDKDLLTRWYQSGAFYPFFRGHAHIDTRRREPYLAGEPYTTIITEAIRLRYSLLPIWYTAFYEASVNGTPILRPHYIQYPGDKAGFSIDDQFFVGGTGLLAKPVVAKDVTSVEVYLPDNEIYYDYFTYEKYNGKGKVKISTPLEKIPLLMQGGHIISRKDRLRRSSHLMRWDPYTLIVVLSRSGEAKGELYLDDGETFNFQKGAYIYRQFEFKDNILQSRNIGGNGRLTTSFRQEMKIVGIERIVIVGAPTTWSKVNYVMVGKDKASLQFFAETGSKSSWAIIKAPNISIADDWMIRFPTGDESREL
ncbi:hypothetical protein Golomagni_01762 [Golovinomyces magnicellulatus]|nr:hypothetical protein Golomagni_01762 [Golovinomyces magnicellulatus]